MRSVQIADFDDQCGSICDPADLNARGIEWSIDRLQLTPGLLCAIGWCASRHGDSILASLILHFSNGDTSEFPLQCQLERTDVTATKPELPAHCGFFLYTAMTPKIVPEKVFFRVTHGSNRPILIPLQVEGTSTTSSYNPKGLIFFHYLSRTITHLRQGNWRLLAQRIRSTLPSLLAKRARSDLVTGLLESLPPQTILIVDHNLGGGANHYRDSLIAEYSSQQHTILLWTFSPVILSFQLELISPDGERQAYKVDNAAWDALVDCKQIERLIFNNAVSYPQPDLVPDMLMRFALTYRENRKLTLLVHDFFMVCPSHFLLNNVGQYCGVPDITRCHSCLPAIENSLTNLFDAADIVLWRSLWLKPLQQADEIVCFSENSRTQLLRAYPKLTDGKVIVRPHRLDYLTGSFRYPGPGSPLRVAMVGAISQHKGSEQFVALANAAQSRSRNIEFLVIGSLIHRYKPDNVIETGPYLREHLPELLRQHGVHMVLVLSICPETFSYVTHELIQLGVPLIAYSIGAQGEAAQRYHLGKVVELGDSNMLLDTIFDFKSELDRILP